MLFRRPKCKLYSRFFILISMLASIQAFVVEDSCIANGKVCKEDSDCCSSWCPYGGPYWANKCQATSNCNGNCPGANCRGCQCPATKNMINVDTFCNSDSGWNSNCCKCIVNRISGGNSNFQRFRSQNEIGVIPIDFNSFCYHPCSFKSINQCDWQLNKICAQTIYKQTNSWVFWDSEAKACGCLN